MKDKASLTAFHDMKIWWLKYRPEMVVERCLLTGGGGHKKFRIRPHYPKLDSSRQLRKLTFTLKKCQTFFNVWCKPWLRAEHTFYKSRSALRVGVKTMICCRLNDSVMMRYPLVSIPPGVPSLADEVVNRSARYCTGRVQEDVKQLPWVQGTRECWLLAATLSSCWLISFRKSF